jgi:COP9 signalosome complex subunit 3
VVVLLLQDGNLGLAKLVVASLTTRNIQRLTTTYLTLSLADIASRVGLPSPEAAEMHILA